MLSCHYEFEAVSPYMTQRNKINKEHPRKGLLERRDRILEAAAEVFAEKGLERATVDDIAVRAGVGKGTVYRRVGKKEDFTDILCQHAAKLIFDSIESEIKKRADPILQFKEAVYALCDVFEEHLSLMILVMSQMGYRKQSKEKSCATQKSISRLFQLIEGILKKAIKKGQVRPVDVHAVVKGLFHFLTPYYYHYLRFKCDYTRGEVAQLTVDLFLDGLRSTKRGKGSIL